MIFKKIANPCVKIVAMVSTKVSCKLVTSEGDLIAWLGNYFGWESLPNQPWETFLEMELSSTSKTLSSLNPGKKRESHKAGHGES